MRRDFLELLKLNRLNLPPMLEEGAEDELMTLVVAVLVEQIDGGGARVGVGCRTVGVEVVVGLRID